MKWPIEKQWSHRPGEAVGLVYRFGDCIYTLDVLYVCLRVLDGLYTVGCGLGELVFGDCPAGCFIGTSALVTLRRCLGCTPRCLSVVVAGCGVRLAIPAAVPACLLYPRHSGAPGLAVGAGAHGCVLC